MYDYVISGNVEQMIAEFAWILIDYASWQAFNKEILYIYKIYRMDFVWSFTLITYKYIILLRLYHVAHIKKLFTDHFLFDKLMLLIWQ